MGKVVCIGHNYADHVRELGNVLPESPVYFMKPSTALVPLEAPIRLPQGRGVCHHELELAVLIGHELRAASLEQARDSIAGFGVALDLTLRELQTQLKAQGRPWEKAKAFDGACPMSPFERPPAFQDPQCVVLELRVNGAVRQRGNTSQMLLPLLPMLADMSTHFTLLPGDIVLTGTPAGVGLLQPGDRLGLTAAHLAFETSVT